ncbi:hypothetical protein BD779DRAFT_161730 [Infundibulicybe gibba]|nr:hypothetical protein BD779DRAFT_161730 [Infundibulicybe gibba]
MMSCIAAEGVATYSLAKYKSQKNHINSLGAHMNSNGLVPAQDLTNVACALVATIFGAEFALLLFWPRMVYPPWCVHTRMALASSATILVAAATLMNTVIIAHNSAFITGVNSATAQQYLALFSWPPIRYRSWPANIIYLVLLWIGFIGTVISTALLLTAANRLPVQNTSRERKEDEKITTDSF